jgi:outer membrane protein TolC
MSWSPFLSVLLLLSSAEVPSSASEILTLDQALHQAEAKNPDLARAREKRLQSKELSKRVLANYLPQLSVGASYTRNQYDASFSLPTGFWLRDLSAVPGFDPRTVNGPVYDPTKGAPSSSPDTTNPPGAPSTTVLFPTDYETLTMQKKDQVGLKAQLTQALIVPALWPAFEIADLGERATAATVEAERRELLFAVVQLYYGCVGLKEVIGIQERLLENDRVHEEEARVRVESGNTPRITLIRAQIDRTKAEQDLVRARMSYASAKIALGTLLDREADFEVEAPAEPQVQAQPAELEAHAQAQRPDLVAARLAQTAAERQRTAVFYTYAPSIVGTASYQLANVKGFTNSYSGWAAGVALSWTLWDGGLRESTLREASSKLAEANAAVRSAELKTRDEVRRAFLDLESARVNRAKAEETVKLARENLALIDVGFKAGVATPLEASDASTALAAAELGLVSETLNAQLAVLKLAKAAGRFDPRR